MAATVRRAVYPAQHDCIDYVVCAHPLGALAAVLTARQFNVHRVPVTSSAAVVRSSFLDQEHTSNTNQQHLIAYHWNAPCNSLVFGQKCEYWSKRATFEAEWSLGISTQTWCRPDPRAIMPELCTLMFEDVHPPTAPCSAFGHKRYFCSAFTCSHV